MYTNFGFVYQALSEYEKASEYLDKALNIDTKLYGVDNHPSIACAHRKL